MTRLRHLALYLGMRLVEWASRHDDVAVWAFRHPMLAYQWLETGRMIETRFPAAVDALLAQEVVVPVSRLDVN